MAKNALIRCPEARGTLQYLSSGYLCTEECCLPALELKTTQRVRGESVRSHSTGGIPDPNILLETQQCAYEWLYSCFLVDRAGHIRFSFFIQYSIPCFSNQLHRYIEHELLSP